MASAHCRLYGNNSASISWKLLSLAVWSQLYETPTTYKKICVVGMFALMLLLGFNSHRWPCVHGACMFFWGVPSPCDTDTRATKNKEIFVSCIKDLHSRNWEHLLLWPKCVDMICRYSCGTDFDSPLINLPGQVIVLSWHPSWSCPC